MRNLSSLAHLHACTKLFQTIIKKMNSGVTVIVIGLRKSEVSMWINRHTHLDISSIELILAYHINDTELSSHIPLNMTEISGPYSALERLRQCLQNVKTDYAFVAASDDQILYTPTAPANNRVDVLSGFTFFRFQDCLRPSTNNYIDLSKPVDELLTQYWMIPNPGDNSLFYSVFKTKLLSTLLNEIGDFEASDWCVVHNALQRATFERSKSFVIIREPPLSLNHYTKNYIAKHIKKHETTEGNWWLDNPILFALKAMNNSTPSNIVSLLKPYWALWLSQKYIELTAVNQTYKDVINKADLHRLSTNIINNLSSMNSKDFLSNPINSSITHSESLKI